MKSIFGIVMATLACICICLTGCSKVNQVGKDMSWSSPTRNTTVAAASVQKPTSTTTQQPTNTKTNGDFSWSAYRSSAPTPQTTTESTGAFSKLNDIGKKMSWSATRGDSTNTTTAQNTTTAATPPPPPEPATATDPAGKRMSWSETNNPNRGNANAYNYKAPTTPVAIANMNAVGKSMSWSEANNPNRGSANAYHYSAPPRKIVFSNPFKNMSWEATPGGAKRVIPPEDIVAKPYAITFFDDVIVKGNARVILQKGKPAVVVRGYKNYVKHTPVNITDRTLLINAPTGGKEPLLVMVSSPYFKKLELSNTAAVEGDGIESSCLEITLEHDASIKLQGTFDIQKLTQNGHGKVEIAWVDSNNVNIESNASGPIYLAGIAKKLYAKLTKDADLDARYLRTDAVVVLATDKATAEVNPLKSLDAFADVNSNIYYHHLPPKINAVGKESGDVLQVEHDQP